MLRLWRSFRHVAKISIYFETTFNVSCIFLQKYTNFSVYVPLVSHFLIKIAIFLSQRLNLNGSSCGGDAQMSSAVILGIEDADVACAFPDFLIATDSFLRQSAVVPDNH